MGYLSQLPKSRIEAKPRIVFKAPVGFNDELLALVSDRLVAVVEQRHDGLQQRRDLDDLCAEGLQTLSHVVDAACHGLRVLLRQALDQLFDDLLVLLDLAVHQNNLEPMGRLFSQGSIAVRLWFLINPLSHILSERLLSLRTAPNNQRMR